MSNDRDDRRYVRYSTGGPAGPSGAAGAADEEAAPGSGAAWAPLEPSFVGDDPGTPRRRGGRHRQGRRRGHLLGYILVAVFAFVLGVGTGYARAYFQSGEIGAVVEVTIPPGATLRAIADELEAKGVVKHARAFVIRAESDGYATKFKPGTYQLRVNEPYERVVALLVEGVRPPTVKVTIPEGSTLEQSADLVAATARRITRGSYASIARNDPPPFELGGYTSGSTLEGLLFPATYEFDPKIGPRAFIEKQLTAFSDNMTQVDLTRARKANLTPYEVVIVASLVEREAQVAAERPLVAAVVWNRLRDGMLLQIDATIQYALGENKPMLTYDDLEVESPYNTYKHPGLPPTPIANPGLDALKAAADPADVDYLFYVARNDGTGRHYFSNNYDQFLADKAKAAANAE